MFGSYDVEARQSKVKKDRRVISLRPIAGKQALSSTGPTDPRLFTGENQLLAEYSNTTGMWSLRYTVGAVPYGLQHKFTQFESLLDYVKQYFKGRNVEIAGVKD